MVRSDQKLIKKRVLSLSFVEEEKKVGILLENTSNIFSIYFHLLRSRLPTAMNTKSSYDFVKIAIARTHINL